MTDSGDDGTGLPASIEAAWGLRDRPAKGPRPGLSLDRIVAAAVALAAAEGLGAVSMGRVAKELGVSTMSLYRYVAAKDELYVLMQDAAAGPPPLPPPPGTGWREAVTAWALAQRELLHRNLWLLRVPISGPPATPNSVAWWERGLSALADTGLDDGEKLSVIMLITGWVRSEAALTADLGAAADAGGTDADEATRRYAATLARLVDPDRFPAVAGLLRSGVLSEPEPGTEDRDYDFEFGMGTILDGIEARVRKRGGGDDR
ncbi:TetR/AcrR family transcriptional regulator [Streptomyces sp. NPDC055078]